MQDTSPTADATDSEPVNGDQFNFRGTNTTFINRPADVVLSDFQNNYITGTGSQADEVNKHLKDLVELILKSKDLPDADKNATVQAVTNVAEQVKDDKANGLTVKGVLDAVGDVVEKAVDIAPAAAGILATVLKFFGV